ncbi:MFS transporter [Francisella frigiditurris]|uniref:Sugar (And other) transporter family protein n=1 Tax=Francisella frigiditurris TaxID=1542390 RepID=A0A1J0KTK6_9GAMM|nr:MFS transporter [Francisella frigiditurris]APC97015.1 sugar (and other) transporter family protein [Francisella frigiditurris]
MKKTHIQLVTLAIITIMGMDLIDTTVMNNILPKIAETFDVTPVHLKMGISIYMIIMGMFLPISSWIAEKVGYRKTLIFAASGFGFFSMMTGLATSDIQMFTYRGFQGLFAAFSAPVASLAYLKFSENMLEGTASLSNYTLIMAVVGQILGGMLASISPESWRLAFLLQVPFALFAILILYKIFPKEDLLNKDRKFDFLGLTIIGLSISFLFILSEVILKDVAVWIKISLAVGVCFSVSLYAFVYRKIKDPVIDFSIFKNHDFKIPFYTNFLCRLSVYWVFFAWPVVLYNLSHLNTIYISIMSVFLMLGTIVSKKVTKKLIYHYGYKLCMIVGLIGIAFVLSLSIVFDIHYHYFTFCLMAMAYGFVLGMYQTSSNAVMYTVIDKSKLDSVNTLKNSSNMISSAFALTAFTLAYDFYHMLGSDHHWEKVFSEAYYAVVLSAAIIQILLALWIFFGMRNIRENL